MSAKATSKRAGNLARVASNATVRARQGAKGRAPQAGVGSAPPAMRASARQGGTRAPDAARVPRKARRARNAPSLGGRVAAAVRMMRLRASRAAEEYGMRR